MYNHFRCDHYARQWEGVHQPLANPPVNNMIARQLEGPQI